MSRVTRVLSHQEISKLSIHEEILDIGQPALMNSISMRNRFWSYNLYSTSESGVTNVVYKLM
jgi:hypothetical protein